MSTRALLYLRVSDDPTGGQVSVSSQEVENRQFCDRMGWTVAGVVLDNDRSASRYALREREGFRRLPAALSGTTAEFGRVDVLVSWEASRNQRDLADYVVLRQLCIDHGVKLAYKGRTHDLSRPDDRFTTGMDALLAEREADDIRERTLRGIRAKAAQGAPFGHVGFGYRRRYDVHTRRLVGQELDEVTAPIVRELAERVLRGDTLYQIARDFNVRNLPTPLSYKDSLRDREVDRGGWTSSKIRRVLAQRGLTGHREHNGEVHPEQTWPAILPVERWEQVQAVLADPHRARHHGGVENRYLLSGIARCGPCSAWMRPARNRGRLVYQCGGHGDHRGKAHVSRPMEPLDALVELAVVMRLSDPGLLDRLGRQDGDDTAALARRELAGLRQRLVALEDDVAGGKLSGAAFGRIEQRLTAAIADAEQRARPRSMSPAVGLLAGPDADAAWQTAELATKRGVIRALLLVTVNRSDKPRGWRGFDVDSIAIRDAWA